MLESSHRSPMVLMQRSLEGWKCVNTKERQCEITCTNTLSWVKWSSLEKPSVFWMVLNITLCFSSLPCNGDRDDAELLGHLFHWRSVWSSSRRHSLDAALRVQGPGGHQIPREACGESRLQRDLCDSGHTIPWQAHWWCAQQVPASSPPQVGTRWWDMGRAWGSAMVTIRCCGGNLSLARGISSRCHMPHWVVAPRN